MLKELEMVEIYLVINGLLALRQMNRFFLNGYQKHLVLLLSGQRVLFVVLELLLTPIKNRETFVRCVFVGVKIIASRIKTNLTFFLGCNMARPKNLSTKGEFNVIIV